MNSFAKFFALSLTITILFYYYALDKGACLTEKEKFNCQTGYILYNNTHCKASQNAYTRIPSSAYNILVECLRQKEFFTPSIKEIFYEPDNFIVIFFVFFAISLFSLLCRLFGIRENAYFHNPPLFFIICGAIISKIISNYIFPICNA